MTLSDLQLVGKVEDIASNLLGMSLRTEYSPGATGVIITEVEAYAGPRDPASHAYRGRTQRNRSMFGPSGVLYVYRSYGIHWCMNIVTGDEGDPSAVLLRAGIPTEGRDVMETRRGRSENVANGPGRLTQALGVTGEADGSSVLDGPVRLVAGQRVEGIIEAGPRVGISHAVDHPWRFVLTPHEAEGAKTADRS